MKLQVKTVIIILLVFLFFGSLASYFAYDHTRDTVIELEKEKIKQITYEFTDEIGQIFYFAELSTQNLANNDIIIDYLQAENPEPQVENLVSYLNNENLGDLYSAIYILNKNGKTLLSTNPDFVGKDYSFRNYYKQALVKGDYIEFALGITSQEMGYYFSHSVVDDTGAIGVVVFKMKPDSINNNITFGPRLSRANVMLVDQDGIVVFSNQEDRMYQSLGVLSAETKDRLLEEKKFIGVETESLQYQVIQDEIDLIQDIRHFDIQGNEDKKREIITVGRIKNYDFFILIEEEIDRYIESAVQLAYWLSILVFLTALLIGIIITAIINKLMKPIEKLSQAADQVGKGNYDVYVEPKKDESELSTLAKTFNEMVLRIKEADFSVKQKVERQTEEISKQKDELMEKQDKLLEVLTDITKEKQKTEEMAKDLRKFKMAVDNAHDMIVITDPDGIVLYANKATEKITGFDNDMMIGKKIGTSDLWGGLMPDDYYKEMWQIIKQDKNVYNNQITNKRKNGEKYEALIQISPVLNKKGEVVFFVTIEKDITERIVAEQQVNKVLNDLQERSQKLAEEKYKAEAMLGSIGEGLIATDQDGKIISTNKAAESMLGYDEEHLLGKSIIDAVEMVDEKGNTVPVGERPSVIALSSGKKYEVPISQLFYYIRKNGEKFAVDVTVTPYVFEGKIIGTILVFRDVTLETNIDQAKTEFVSLASHQLRTPLSAINWYTEMLLNGDAGKLSEDQKEFIDNIYKGNKRMIELVNALLNVSRLELGTFMIEPKEVDMIELANDVIDELKMKIKEKKIKLEKQYSSNSMKLQADQKLLRIALQNLLSNAVKYTPEKGKVKISIEKKQDGYHVSVSDTGYGIPKHQQDKIFSKLFRADNVKQKDVEGTGLGLYIVKSIIENSNGEIWFESEEGKGTTFSFILPPSGMPKKTGSKSLN